MLLIYTSYITPRIRYIMQYVFDEQFGLSYKIINDEQEFLKDNAATKIVYSKDNIGNCLYFFSADLLFENDVKELTITVDKINDITVLFKHDENDALGFDVFAAIFYLLSRYEEYLNKPTDKFGNFDFKNSILYQQNCLHTPGVEQWINMLKEALIQKFPSLQFKKTEPQFALSFDIDVAYEYNNRSFVRTIGGIAKKIFKLNFTALKNQLLTLAHIKSDAFDTYDYIFSKIKNNKAIFFFNMGRYGEFDKNPSYKNKKFRQRITKISENNYVGLHPSYASNSNYNLIAEEKKQLEEIIKRKITSSRQHYLKLKFPETYEQLIQNGIEKDYTIGYHDTYGFRAGTCNSFLFFNLIKNETTNLRLFPFAIMEGTLDDVMKLNVEASKKIMSALIAEVCKYNGLFIPLWHNSTLCTKERREIFEYILAEIEKRKMKNFFK